MSYFDYIRSLGAAGGGSAAMRPPGSMPSSPPVPPAPPGKFSIDLERAPQLIAELELAVEDAKRLHAKALSMTVVTPPGRDAVSQRGAKAVGSQAGAGAGNLGHVVGKYAASLEAVLDNVRKSVSVYRGRDGGAAKSF